MILRRKIAKVFEPLLAPARYKGAYGGRGSGKSHFFGEQLVEDCLAEPGLLSVCIREVQKSLAQSSKRLIEDKIRSLGVERSFKVFKDKIETPGDGLIIFQGMQDPAVNNSARQNMADLRVAFDDLLWFDYGIGSKAVTHAYASATSTTLAGPDVTAIYQPGRRVRASGSSTGTIYGAIAASSYAGSTTTISYIWDGSALVSEALTISLSQIPVTGFPVPAAAIAATPVVQNYLTGLTLSTAGGSASFGIATGQAADSGNAYMMTLAAALTKTTAAWTVGTGDGALDTAPSPTRHGTIPG